MVGKFYFPRFLKITTLQSSFRSDFFKVVNSDGSIVYTRNAKLIRLLSEVLNFEFKISYVVDNSYGKDMGNGSWTGLVGNIQRGESDLATFAMAEDRNRVVDYSYPHLFADVTFLTHEPKAMPKSLAIYYPFSLAVWISLLLALVMVSLLFFLETNRQKSFVKVLLVTFGSILEKSLKIPFNSYGGRYLFFTWTVGVMFLSYSYKATLLSYLSLPPTTGIQTIAELSSAVAEGTYICMALKNSYIPGSLMKSSESDLRIIGKSLSENQFAPNQAQILPPDEPNRKVAFISAKSNLLDFQGAYFISRDVFFTMMFSVVTRRGFCCKKILNRTTRRMFEAGLFEKITREQEFLHSLEKSILQTGDKQALNLQDMSGSFMILACGYILSLITCLIEIVYDKLKK